MVSGSNTTRSAVYPGAISPRLPRLNLLAGKEVIFLTASSRVSNFFSHVPGEDVREGTVKPRVGFFSLLVKAVRGDKRSFPPEHLLYVGACHVEEHDGDFAILLEEKGHHAILGVYPSTRSFPRCSCLPGSRHGLCSTRRCTR